MTGFDGEVSVPIAFLHRKAGYGHFTETIKMTSFGDRQATICRFWWLMVVSDNLQPVITYGSKKDEKRSRYPPCKGYRERFRSKLHLIIGLI